MCRAVERRYSIAPWLLSEQLRHKIIDRKAGSTRGRSMRTRLQGRLGLGAALTIFFALFFFSLVKNSQIQRETFHVGFDPGHLEMIWIPVTLTIAVGAVFLVAEFSFGYMAGFYLFAMMA